MRISFIVLLMGISLVSYSQTEIVTLEECIQTALQENLSVKGSRYEAREFQEKVKEVRRSAMPQVNLNASYDYYFELPSQVAPSSFFGETEGPAYVPLQFGVPNQTSATLQLRQLIYNPELSVGIKAAKTGIEIAELNSKKTREEVVYNVSRTYFNAQAIQTQIRLLEENEASLNELIRVSQLLYESNLIKQTDVDRLRLNKANLENNISNQQISYDYQIRALGLLTNTPATEEITIDTTLVVAPETIIQDNDSIARTELELLQKQGEVIQLEDRQILSRYQPSLSAVAVYGQSGFGDYSEDFFEFYPFSYVGLQLSLPVFDGFVKKSQHEQKKIALQKHEADYELARRSFENEYLNASSRIEIQKKELQTQYEALDLAKKIYDNIQLQYQEGLVGVQEIIESENELRRTQTDYLNAWISLKNANLDLMKAKGTLLK